MLSLKFLSKIINAARSIDVAELVIAKPLSFVLSSRITARAFFSFLASFAKFPSFEQVINKCLISDISWFARLTLASDSGEFPLLAKFTKSVGSSIK